MGKASAASWWQEGKSRQVYIRGILGECPATAETNLTPIDAHPLPKQTTIAWGLVYSFRLDDERFREALSNVLRDYPLLAGRFASPKKSSVLDLLGRRRQREKQEKNRVECMVQDTSQNNDAYCLRGTLSEGLTILHNNAGVTVTVGKSTLSSADFKHQCIVEDHASNSAATNPPCYLDPMNLKRVFKGLDPILSIRLTYLADGGTILGIVCPHAVVDGRSLAAFLVSLSLEYQNEAYEKPVLDRDLLTMQPLVGKCTREEIAAFNEVGNSGQSSGNARDKLEIVSSVASELGKYFSKGRKVNPVRSNPDDACSHIDDDVTLGLSVWKSIRFLSGLAWEVAKGGKLKSIVVLIEPEQIRKIKEEQSANDGFVSKNDIAVAYSWILLRSLQERLGYLRNSGGRETKARMLFAADLRVDKRLETPLSRNYFGNAVLAVAVSSAPNMTLSEGAGKVRHVVNSLAKQNTKSIIESIWKLNSHNASFAGGLPALVASLPCYHDCFVTSWQFPYHSMTFGGSSPHAIYPGLFPSCPWTAIVMGSGPSASTGNSEGVYVHMTMPCAAFDILQGESTLPSQLMEGARVITQEGTN